MSIDRRKNGHSAPSVTRRRRPSRFDGWIAFLDIFGFGSHLESDFFPDAEIKLLKMHEALHSNKLFRASSAYFMFSDSIVLWTSSALSDDRALRKLIERISIAQNVAAESGFLLRGSLAYGRILIAQNYILGDAYLRAYRFEAQQLIDPIVVIPRDEIQKASLLDIFGSEMKEIKTKRDNTQLAMQLNFVSWDQIKTIKGLNVAAIMSSPLSNEAKTTLAERWNSIPEK